MLEISANSAATLLYSIISGAGDTSSYQYSFSTYEDGVVHYGGAFLPRLAWTEDGLTRELAAPAKVGREGELGEN